VTARRTIGRLLLGLVLVCTLALPGSLLYDSTSNAAAYSPISIVFDRPAYAAINQTVQCKVTMYGGPAADMGGNYNWTGELIAANDTGAEMLPSVGAQSATGVWFVNITMPEFGPEILTIKIIGTSTASTSGSSVTASTTFEMKVVVPILIKAAVHNNGDVDASNVTAKIFADGVLLDTQVINVSAGSSATISYNWTFLDIKRGRHVVTVTVDDPNDVVEFSDGNNVFSQVIYVGSPGNPAAVGLTIGVIIAAILVALMWLQKPVRRPSKKQ
jgi:hypothetical protein